jgi:hypothetical protein
VRDRHCPQPPAIKVDRRLAVWQSSLTADRNDAVEALLASELVVSIDLLLNQLVVTYLRFYERHPASLASHDFDHSIRSHLFRWLVSALELERNFRVAAQPAGRTTGSTDDRSAEL